MGVKAIFQTKDISLAAYLQLKKFDIVDLHRDGNVVFFWFEQTKEIRKSVLAFFNDDGEHKTFSNSLKDLKTLIYNQ